MKKLSLAITVIAAVTAGCSSLRPSIEKGCSTDETISVSTLKAKLSGYPTNDLPPRIQESIANIRKLMQDGKFDTSTNSSMVLRCALNDRERREMDYVIDFSIAAQQVRIKQLLPKSDIPENVFRYCERRIVAQNESAIMLLGAIFPPAIWAAGAYDSPSIRPYTFDTSKPLCYSLEQRMNLRDKLNALISSGKLSTAKAIEIMNNLDSTLKDIPTFE